MSSSFGSTGHDIAFAHGRIGVLQQLLLGRSDVDRLLGAHDARETARIFTELRFTSSIDQGISDPEQILASTAQWVRDEVASMAPEKDIHIFDILWLEGDVPVFAYLLKEKRGLTSAISRLPLAPLSAYPIEAWQELVATGKSLILPSSAVTALQTALALEHPTPAAIDTIAAQWGVAEQLRLAKTVRSHEIREYVRSMIDLENIRSTVRSLERPADERQSLLLKGGTLPHELFLGNREQIASELLRAGFNQTVVAAMTADDQQQLEQAMSQVIAAQIARMWNIPLSIEPLFAFAALALSQLKLLRTILLAKRAGFSPQETKRALPPFLPATHYIA